MGKRRIKKLCKGRKQYTNTMKKRNGGIEKYRRSKNREEEKKEEKEELRMD